MKFSFPWFAAGTGLLLAMVLLKSGVLGDAADRGLPLLTMLFISEFGFFVTAAGSFVAGKSLLNQGRSWKNLLLTAACGVLAIAFFSLGILLWQGSHA
ncbi:MAG: hypothetical protein P8045_00615 [Candidatus Thiodiazotropha sp.]|jgi:hypothetical protein